MFNLRLVAVVALAGVVAYVAPASGQADGEAAPIFGVNIPGYRDWRLISVAHEEGDLNDLRAILRNDVGPRHKNCRRPTDSPAEKFPGARISKKWGAKSEDASQLRSRTESASVVRWCLLPAS